MLPSFNIIPIGTIKLHPPPCNDTLASPTVDVEVDDDDDDDAFVVIP